MGFPKSGIYFGAVLCCRASGNFGGHPDRHSWKRLVGRGEIAVVKLPIVPPPPRLGSAHRVLNAPPPAARRRRVARFKTKNSREAPTLGVDVEIGAYARRA
jgi:hypothetical protein